MARGKNVRYCSERCRKNKYLENIARSRRANPEHFSKVNKRYEYSEKGKATRKRNYFRKTLSKRFKRYVKREMKVGTSFTDAMDSVKTVIKAEYASLGMDVARAGQIVDNEYARIMENYRQKVIQSGHD